MFFQTTIKDATGTVRSAGDEVPEHAKLTGPVLKHYEKMGWIGESKPEPLKEAKPLKGGGGRKLTAAEKAAAEKAAAEKAAAEKAAANSGKTE